MIDIGIFKYFIVGYRQFIAYTRDIKDKIIDFLKANIILIKFRYGSISFMRSILLQTLISYIKFHIIKTNTLFLLYFKDID